MILDCTAILNFETVENQQKFFRENFKVTLPISAFKKARSHSNLKLWLFAEDSDKAHLFIKRNNAWCSALHTDMGLMSSVDKNVVAVISNESRKEAWAYVDNEPVKTPVPSSEVSK